MSDPQSLEKKEFDTRVHIRDPKTGFVVRKQPYRLICEGGNHIFIRGGKKFYADGTPVDKPEVAK